MDEASNLLSEEQNVARLERQVAAATKERALQEELERLKVFNSKFRPFTSLIFMFVSLGTSSFSALMIFEDQVDYNSDFRFASLTGDYPMVTAKMLVDIVRRRLNVRDIPKFTADFASADVRDASKVKNMIQLMRPFEVFCQIVCHLAPAPMQQPLQKSMQQYRDKLMNRASYNTFDSINQYHIEFVARAMKLGLDDPVI